MPNVVPGRQGKVRCERGVEQPVQRGRAEHEEADRAAEHGEIEVPAPLRRATLGRVEPPLRLPPVEAPRGETHEDEGEVRRGLAVGMRVHPHELAPEDADRSGRADRGHREAECRDAVRVRPPDRRSARELGLACRFRLDDPTVEKPERHEDDRQRDREAEVVHEARVLLLERVAE